LAERTDLKPQTIKSLRQTQEKLVAFFGVGRPMRSVTRDEASRWRATLLADGLAMATVRLHVGNARTLFDQAEERELIPRNPFDHLPSGMTAAQNEWYITPDEAERVLAELSDPPYPTRVRLGALRRPARAVGNSSSDVGRCGLGDR
jgi:site-specific recombinase XerD